LHVTSFPHRYTVYPHKAAKGSQRAGYFDGALFITAATRDHATSYLPTNAA